MINQRLVLGACNPPPAAPPKSPLLDSPPPPPGGAFGQQLWGGGPRPNPRGRPPREATGPFSSKDGCDKHRDSEPSYNVCVPQCSSPAHYTLMQGRCGASSPLAQADWGQSVDPPPLVMPRHMDAES